MLFNGKKRRFQRLVVIPCVYRARKRIGCRKYMDYLQKNAKGAKYLPRMNADGRKLHGAL